MTVLEQAILATDLASYFEKKDKFKVAADEGEIDWQVHNSTATTLQHLSYNNAYLHLCRIVGTLCRYLKLISVINWSVILFVICTIHLNFTRYLSSKNVTPSFLVPQFFQSNEVNWK